MSITSAALARTHAVSPGLTTFPSYGSTNRREWSAHDVSGTGGACFPAVNAAEGGVTSELRSQKYVRAVTNASQLEGRGEPTAAPRTNKAIMVRSAGRSARRPRRRPPAAPGRAGRARQVRAGARAP